MLFVKVASQVGLCCAVLLATLSAHAVVLRGSGHADLNLQAGATTRVVVLVAAMPSPTAAVNVVAAGVPAGAAASAAANAASKTPPEDTPREWARVPLLRDARELNSAGVALASFAPKPLSVDDLSGQEWQQSLDAAAATLQRSFPGAQLVLAGLGSGAGAALAWAAGNGKAFSHALFVGAQYRAWRNLPASTETRSTLIVHTPTQTCAAASYIEAGEAAMRLKAQFVKFYYPAWDTSGSCSLAGQLGLGGHDTTLRNWVLDWLEGKNISGEYGTNGVSAAYGERLQRLEIPAALGEGYLESTVLTPTGEGPHPLMVFHHGDILEDSASIARKQRFVDWIIAREFLELGYAVAFPQRPGVGGSDGKYPRVFYGESADPTIKGRIHGAFSVWATEAARLAPRVDPNRVVVSGQSAGGYAVMAIASINPPWAKALINYSGGRSSATSGGGLVSGVRVTDGSRAARRDDAAQPSERSMIEGFRTFGKTARTPLLMIFSENDSRYRKDIIENAVTAYTEAGGSGSLKMYPPEPRDGHWVYHNAKVWRQDVRDFLQAQGLPSTPVKP